MKRRFDQLDVFSDVPLQGNPLAVVHDATGLDDERLAAFARWTNLSETTFLLPPTDALADYRVRIFTPGGELPFAGHPTLGSCHAWLAAGGRPRDAGMIVQQCGVGRVRVRRSAAQGDHGADGGQGGRLAFAAPPVRRSEPLDDALLAQITRGLRLPAGAVRAHQWVDNGPGWCAVLLDSAEAVRALQPDWPALGDLKLGVVGAQAAGSDSQFEVRALIADGAYEDPVTGSLNASVAQWLIGAKLAPPNYIASQGAALRRSGRVHIETVGADIWVGGDVAPLISGEVDL